MSDVQRYKKSDAHKLKLHISKCEKCQHAKSVEEYCHKIQEFLEQDYVGQAEIPYEQKMIEERRIKKSSKKAYAPYDSDNDDPYQEQEEDYSDHHNEKEIGIEEMIDRRRYDDIPIETDIIEAANKIDAIEAANKAVASEYSFKMEEASSEPIAPPSDESVTFHEYYADGKKEDEEDYRLKLDVAYEQAELDVAERAILHFYFYEGLTFRQIAERMGYRAHSPVQYRYNMAIAKLRNFLVTKK